MEYFICGLMEKQFHTIHDRQNIDTTAFVVRGRILLIVYDKSYCC